MNISVYFHPGKIDESSVKDKSIVIIDVLRASTTICKALHAGAKELIPVHSVEQAVKLSSNLFEGQYLLGGERNGKRIEGFNLGNSPSEYAPDSVKDKSIVFVTTNGTNAIMKARTAKTLLIGGFVNLSHIVKTVMSENPHDLLLVCGGKELSFCIEDALCAGAIIDSIIEKGQKVELNDAGVAASIIWKNSKKSFQYDIENSDHARYLTSVGFEADIAICSNIDSLSVIPHLNKFGVIKDLLKA